MEGGEVWLGCHTRLDWLSQPCYPSFGMLFQMESAEITNEHKYMILYLVTEETVPITHFLDSLCWSLLLSHAHISPLKKIKNYELFSVSQACMKKHLGKVQKKKKGFIGNCYRTVFILSYLTTCDCSPWW